MIISFSDSQYGATLFYTILTLTTLAALGAAVTLLTAGSDQTMLTDADALRARYLALSGLNLWNDGRTGTFSIGQDAIQLEQQGPDAAGNYTVASTGIVHAGTALEARQRVTAKRASASTITFGDDIGDFTTPVNDQTTTNPLGVVIFGDNPEKVPTPLTLSEWTSLWSQNISRYAGGWMRLGGDGAKTVGAAWYNGTKGTCTAGACSFAAGLRVYFHFVFDDCDTHPQSKDYGDGFTFAVITAANDPDTAVGGPASGVRSELLGYAGPGTTGEGISTPKIAIEVDTYPNRGGGDPAEVNSRRDGSNANHIAVVAWGGTDTAYDDNVHGAGQNPTNASTGYFAKAKGDAPYNWLEDGEEHTMRVEMRRDAATATYTVLAWVDPKGDGCGDVGADYAAETPQIRSVLTLAAADSAKLDAVRFGFTEATGSSVSQNVAIHDFSLRFRQ